MKREAITQALHRYREHIIYVLGWFVVLISPLVTVYVRASYGKEQLPWHFLWVVWTVMGIYLLFFLVHNFFVAHYFFRPGKRTYFTFVAGLVTLFIAAQLFTRPFSAPPPPRKPRGEMSVYRPYGKPREMWHHGKRPYGRPLPVERVDLASVFVLLLVFGVNLGVKIYIRNEIFKQQLMQLRQEDLARQLKYLKAQINPHFFMNTLNNIHALVDIDPGKAKSSIILLSKMMRYMLYEGDNALIPLQKEIEFLSNYIDLMRLRFINRVMLSVDLPQQTQGEVPPLLLITFVENAFKHGVSYRQESRINMGITLTASDFCFTCDNTKPTDVKHDAHGGVGLTNVRKRLDLVYGEKYVLRIDDQEDNYAVELRLPLSAGNIGVPEAPKA